MNIELTQERRVLKLMTLGKRLRQPTDGEGGGGGRGLFLQASGAGSSFSCGDVVAYRQSPYHASQVERVEKDGRGAQMGFFDRKRMTGGG